MKSKWMLFFSLGATALALCGCVENLDGRHQAALGWKDRVEGRYDRSPAEIWAATRDVLRHHGTVVSEDTLKNTIEANVDQRKVWVKVEEVDTNVTRVYVQARKGLVDDLEMAAYIDKQIAIRLATGNLTPATPVKR